MKLPTDNDSQEILPQEVLPPPVKLPTEGFPLPAWCKLCNYKELRVFEVLTWRVVVVNGKPKNLFPMAYKSDHIHTSIKPVLANQEFHACGAHVLEFDPAKVAEELFRES